MVENTRRCVSFAKPVLFKSANEFILPIHCSITCAIKAGIEPANRSFITLFSIFIGYLDEDGALGFGEKLRPLNITTEDVKRLINVLIACTNCKNHP